MSWIRQNVDRLILSLAGIAAFVLAVVNRDREAVAISLAFIGAGLFVFGIVLRRAQSLSVGTKGFEARLDEVEHKVDTLPTRIVLANLVAEGDQIVGGLSMAKQTVEADIEARREPSYDRGVWDKELIWLRDVERFVANAPDLGEADAILFDSQVPTPPRKNFKIPERFDDSIDLVRAKQDRIRELIRRLE